MLKVDITIARSAKSAWSNHLRTIGKELAAIDAALAETDRQDFHRRAALALKREILKSGLFDEQYYLKTYRDVREAGLDPLDHYIAFGAGEGRCPNGIFDPHFYCRAHASKIATHTNPLAHYIRHGEAAGLKPAQSFDPVAYLIAHPRIAAAGISPLWHQLHLGGPRTNAPVQRPTDVRVTKLPLRRWVRPPSGSAGVNFVGPIEVVSGLGTSARGYFSALQQAEVEVNVIPWRLGFEHQKRIKATFPRVSRQPINIVHLNADSSHLWLPKLNDLLTPDYYNIAIWFWELSSFRPEWMEVSARFDEIWCASSFSARSIAAISGRPVQIVRPAVPMQPAPGKLTRNDFGFPQAPFIFFYMFDVSSNLDRKNPFALVRAFVEEFRPQAGAMLLLKLNYPTNNSIGVAALRKLVEGRQDVVVMDRVLPAEQLADLWTMVDCYVSPHRSEGLGLTVIEAMYAGKPVIGTPYGGVIDFLTRDTALPLEYSLVEIEETVEPYPAGFVWADPNIASIRTTMRWVFENQEAARRLGSYGRGVATEMFSLPQTAAGVKREIDRIWSPPPPRDTQRANRVATQRPTWRATEGAERLQGRGLLP